MLFWKNQKSFIILLFFIFICILNCFLDISPNVWSIISIKINQLLYRFRLFWVLILKILILIIYILIMTKTFNLIQIISICFISDNIDSFMDSNFWMNITIFFLITCQNSVVWNFLKLYFIALFYIF